MRTTVTKWAITLVMMGVIPATGIIYWGATQLRGKLCIILTGLFVNLALAFWYSWLDRRPKSFTDWLKH